MKIEYRIANPQGAWVTVADDTAGVDRISGYQPIFQKTPYVDPMFGATAPFIGDVGNGFWVVRWTVDTEHASAEAALLAVVTKASVFTPANAVDLKVTVGATTRVFSTCVLQGFTPEPASDRTTVIEYVFVARIYA